MSKLFKRTKILATVGPSIFGEDKILEMMTAGVNGFRINFSHGFPDQWDEMIRWIRAASQKDGKSVAILQDLQGPKIRLGMIKDNRLDLKSGDRLILDADLEEHDGGMTVPIQYNLATKAKVGEPIYLYDGSIKAKVTAIPTPRSIEIEIENSGYIMSKKGINLPDTDFGGEVITEKDMQDIAFGATRDIDFVAMSFVQSAGDIKNLRQILAERRSSAKIIAKIETKKAVESDEHLEEIIKVSDGIMIARGDMAVEVGLEAVPIIQRKLVNLCRKHSKLCIVATQMMMSMVENPSPTRAEVNDVASAVLQGADVVMLSDETANGKYPKEVVDEVCHTILYTQNHTDERRAPAPESKEPLDALADAAVELAEKIDADMLVCETETGATTISVSSQFPNIPIISVSQSRRVANQLSLRYGISSFSRPLSDNSGLDLVAELKAKDYFKDAAGDQLTCVVVSGRFRGQVGGTDTIQIRKV